MLIFYAFSAFVRPAGGLISADLSAKTCRISSISQTSKPENKAFLGFSRKWPILQNQARPQAAGRVRAGRKRPFLFIFWIGACRFPSSQRRCFRQNTRFHARLKGWVDNGLQIACFGFIFENGLFCDGLNRLRSSLHPSHGRRRPASAAGAEWVECVSQRLSSSDHPKHKKGLFHLFSKRRCFWMRLIRLAGSPCGLRGRPAGGCWRC